MSIDTRLAALPSISLTDINAEAAMMTRVDRKYLLRLDELDVVLAALPPTTRALEIGGRRLQAYATTYFDTPEQLSYRMTAQKRRRRFKVRQRVYVDSGLAFCEVKTRGPRGVTVKSRVPISAAEALSERLAEGARGFVAEELRHLPEWVPESLSPTVSNTYRRATLRPPGIGRATIDVDLTWTSDNRHLSGLDLAFIETKSGANPSPLDRILWSQGHRPTRVSKFGTGLAALYPELPSNKWHRLLNTYFKEPHYA
ncbi:polyphosphate polymerase domain-containing protein [Corynebacterium sp. HMSC036D02]|uniref:polyphosphate polymerase domain-containing protein n=1 Tax=Corynebacterium sp. HMSC036D02 TaxID=1715013 RepID=UPI0008A9557D|nr:polyphosphate polymerase domain-containing protein [Corynebacterium sp. HMSC036D02]OHO61535.1 hypothetical protein HMPREF2743_03435 [Corynebacterium sp. HMSC036D02]